MDNKQEKNRYFSFLFIAFALLGIVIYWNSLGGQFVLDDYLNIRDNDYIKTWSNVANYFTHDIGAGSGRSYSYYRPLVTLSYLISYKFFGLNVAGYHATSILLHVFVSLAVYWLILLLFEDKRLSLFTSLLFLVHPVHVQTVAYISNRGELLATLFIVLSLVAYIHWMRNPRRSLYFTVCLTFLCALFSKESAFIIPILCLLITPFLKKKIKLSMFFAFVVLAGFYLSMRLSAAGLTGSHRAWLLSSLERVPGFFVAVLHYVRILFLPAELHKFNIQEVFLFNDLRAILGIVSVLLLLFTAFYQRRRNHIISFSIFWFFVALLPFSNIYPPLPFFASDHHIYLASIGYFLLLSCGFNFLLKSRGLHYVSLPFFVGLLYMLSMTTISQNRYWQGPLIFNTRTLYYVPSEARLYNNLGKFYSEKGIHDKTIGYFLKAIELSPDSYEYRYNLGFEYQLLGRYGEAVESLRKAARINPKDPYVYGELGIAYFNLEQYKNAIFSLRKAIELMPEFSVAYKNLGSAYAQIGEYGDAESAFKKAIELNPRYSGAYQHLGVLYDIEGKNHLSSQYYQKAEALK